MSYFQHLRAVSARHDQCHIFIKTFPMVLNAMAKNIELIQKIQKMSSSGSGARLWLWNRQILQLTPFFCHINWCWSVLTDAWLSTSFEADKQFCVMTRNWGWCQGLPADELQCDTYWDVSSWGQFLQLGDYSGLAQCSVTSSLHHSSLN